MYDIDGKLEKEWEETKQYRMNEIRYSKVLVVLCCLALHIATLSAQNDSVRFFNEVDYVFLQRCMWAGWSGRLLQYRRDLRHVRSPVGRL